MSQSEPLYFKDRLKWRRWLETNFENETEVWLVYYKKHTKIASIAYNDAVEEALCFGWIDGKIRRIDDERFMQRYTPRRPKSKWSMTNRKRVEKLIVEKKMMDAGLIHVKEAKKDGRWKAAYTTKKMPTMPSDLENALKLDKIAWENFNNFTKSNQLMYITYIIDAKRDDTKKRRIAKVVSRARKNEKPGMM